MDSEDLSCECGTLIDKKCNFSPSKSDVNQFCNFCHWEGFVSLYCDICPNCKNYGYFADKQ